jgi:hypothetical protein
MYGAFFALFAALCCRGGLVLLACGIGIVRNDGASASRFRILCRGLLAWLPACAISPVIIFFLYKEIGWLPALLTGATLAGALAVWSLSLKGRGLPDRIAGTWFVPR